MAEPKVPVINGAGYDFQTPPEALLPLYEFLPKDWVIWECAAGKGNLVKALTERGYKVISTDLRTGNDFLMYEPNEHYDCIITNPPYDLKDEFFHRAYLLGKPFAFLVPLTSFEGKLRQSLFSKFGLEVVMFDKRINFEVPEEEGGQTVVDASADYNEIEAGKKPAKKANGSWFMTAWFSNGLKMGKQLTFVSYMGKNKGRSSES